MAAHSKLGPSARRQPQWPTERGGKRRISSIGSQWKGNQCPENDGCSVTLYLGCEFSTLIDIDEGKKSPIKLSTNCDRRYGGKNIYAGRLWKKMQPGLGQKAARSQAHDAKIDVYLSRKYRSTRPGSLIIYFSHYKSAVCCRINSSLPVGCLIIPKGHCPTIRKSRPISDTNSIISRDIIIGGQWPLSIPNEPIGLGFRTEYHNIMLSNKTAH